MLFGLSKKRIILLIIIICIIILSVVISLLYKNNSSVHAFFDEYIFRKNISENNLNKIYINDNSYSYSFNDNLVILSQNKLTFYNKSGNPLTTLDINISEPIFASNGKYLCVAEKDGSSIFLISNRSILWQQKIDGSISCICVNKNGYVAAAITNTSYKTICKLYNETRF